MTRPRLRSAAATVLSALCLASAAACAPHSQPPTLLLGAVFPLTGTAGPLGAEEYAGVRLAAELTNRGGGIDGRLVSIDVRDVPIAADAAAAVDSLHAAGVPLILGGFSSDLSIPASATAARDGMVYWEAGAEADQLTGRGLPTVFRVGATGGQLGANAARFVIGQIAPRLHRQPAGLRVAVVEADDAYAASVADAAVAVLRAGGTPVVSRSLYDPYTPSWAPVIAELRAARPDILLLASHIPDGIAFRRAFLAAGLRVDAFVGSTMAQCLPDFGDALGAQAVGVFASDRPGDGFDPAKLPPAGQGIYDQFAAAWRAEHGRPPTEEALSGFTAAWVLLHQVLPEAARAGDLSPSGIAAVARTINLPFGSLPNGAGVLFATGSQLGQNLRAAAVIWQWQAPRHSVVVWPAAYATGHIELVAGT
ncbi:MAG TPA: ABC transporter substrate-binding protein [Mycobacteriales bacterium]|nr:ABC transporter substrate-binding protein [Mycobacteriales bacterium]